jgi:hypothetical protein
MNRIREDTEKIIIAPMSGERLLFVHRMAIKRTAQRTLLLDRAYRRSRAAFRKADLACVIGDFEKAYMLIRGPRGAWVDNCKAAELYRQAEEL